MLNVATDWPDAGIIHSALRGIRAVFRTEGGQPGAGVVSSLPWVFLVPQIGVICERCETCMPLPDAPTGQGDPTGPRTPLFSKDTKSYAMFLLSQVMYPFLKAHESCAKEEKK